MFFCLKTEKRMYPGGQILFRLAFQYIVELLLLFFRIFFTISVRSLTYIFVESRVE